MSRVSPLAVAIDLGSTAIKVGVLDSAGRLTGVRSSPAPPLRGEGPTREGDAESYAQVAGALLQSVAETVPRGTPLGLATQRSTFTLWDRRDGRPRFPMISWQDRRAADWCARHRGAEAEVVRRTGLPLSPHYIGPKLAALRESDAAFAAALLSPRSALGTLETFLAWRWSAGRQHATDLTVAARSALLDIAREEWSGALLDLCGVPRSVLPELRPTTRWQLALDNGLRLRATLSDQASAALPLLDPSCGSALVNLGTGAFVLLASRDVDLRLPGYLLGPTLATTGGERRYALEGTINGAGPAVDRFAPGPTDLPESDPAPAGFALPDVAGLGSPWWRPEIGLTLSPAAERLDGPGKRRVVLEGLLFRIRAILADLTGPAPPARIVVAGGLTADAALGPALAATLGRPVELLAAREAGLLGAARLAAGLEPFADPPTETFVPGPRGAYLAQKFESWRGWLDALLSAK